MTEQMSLMDAPVVEVPAGRPTLAQRYARWLDDNPHVLDVLVDTARQLRAAGKRPSISRVFEECRERVHTVGDEFTLNNSFRAFVARDLAERHDDLRGVFRTRTSKADDRTRA